MNVEGIALSETEKAICEAIAEAVPHMSEFQRGYFQGVAETVREQAKKAKHKVGEPAEEQPA